MVVSPVGLLATAPGISPAIARRLVAQFGSVAGVAAASRRELEEIRGIGPTKAEALSALLGGSD
jgi:Fanconi anemia group M protein